jgi:hypothetical protein
MAPEYNHAISAKNNTTDSLLAMEKDIDNFIASMESPYSLDVDEAGEGLYEGQMEIDSPLMSDNEILSDEENKNLDALYLGGRVFF